MCVYLSGGMHPKKIGDKVIHWQEELRRVVPECGMIQYLDPRRNRPDSIDESLPHDGWGSLDLWMAAEADIIFGYLERDNPGGEGTIGETYLHRGKKPHGLRIVVLEDALNDSRGEIRELEIDKPGVFEKAFVHNRSRYRRFFMLAGNPYMPLKGSGEFPYFGYQTFNEGLAFFERATQQFVIPDHDEPVFVNLIGDITLTYDGSDWFNWWDKEVIDNHNLIHILHHDWFPLTQPADFKPFNVYERRALRDFFSWKADLVFAYAERGGELRDYANFFTGVASAKAMNPGRLVISVCPDEKILGFLGDHNLTFTELEKAIGFVRIWLKQYAQRVNLKK